MAQVTFSSAPTQARGAALYQHALNVKSFVNQVSDQFAKSDNQPQDLYPAGSTVILKQQKTSVMAPFNRAESECSSMSGSRIGKNLDAKLSNTYKGCDETGWVADYTANVGANRSETPDAIFYEASFTAPRDYSPGHKTTVSEDKKTGALVIDCSNELYDTQRRDWVGVDSQKSMKFGPNGPSEAAAVETWKVAQGLCKEIQAEMEQVKKADQSGLDLNPCAGTVIVGRGNQGEIEETELHFDAKTNQSQAFSHHVEHMSDYRGSTKTWSYRREGDQEVFSATRYSGLEEVRVEADGSMIYNDFAKKVAPEDLKAYNKQAAADKKAAEKLQIDIAKYEAKPYYKKVFACNPNKISYQDKYLGSA